MNTFDFGALFTFIGVLVALTNIFTQVIKKVTWDKAPTNLVAVIVAIVLTVMIGVAFVQINGYVLTWYIFAGFVVLGFMVAYAAMFGFDKLKEIMNWGGWK